MRIARLSVTAVLFVTAAARAQEDGFTPLFNGKDLSGWVPVNVAPKTFTVRDNMIVCDGKPTGVMRTDRHYENFVLELEYMHLVPGGNAGLFVWSDAVTSPGVPFTRSIEVQILDGSNSENHTSHGDIFSIHGATMKPDRPHPRGAMRCLPSERRANPAGQWNHYRVVCNDGAVKLSVNGKEVSGGTECWPRKGYICLESEGGVVHYRNIRVKELPSTHPEPREVATTDVGFKSIYTGVDLSGWRAEAGHQGHWQPRDWTLAYDGKAEGGGQTLWTLKEYGDFEMVVDWRLPEPGKAEDAEKPAEPQPVNGGITLRGAEGPTVQIRSSPEGSGTLSGGTANPAAKPADKRRGGWNRFVISAKGGNCTVQLNGQTIAENATPSGAPPRGPIGLHSDGPIEFANLYVRELSGPDGGKR